jgi:microsomal dipeptidase-like Zn-dependent dipeptidase
MSTRRRVCVASLLVVAAGAAPATAAAAPVYDLAGRCVAIRSLENNRFIAITATGYTANKPSKAGAAAFYLKATGLGTYLLYDQGGQLANVSHFTLVDRAPSASRFSEWAITRDRRGVITIRTTVNRRKLSVAVADGEVGIGGVRETAEMAIEGASGCKRYPEAEVGATGTPHAGVNRDGSVFGFVDAHLHITADMRAGGRVIYGEAYDRFGIPAALGHDADDHGADGSLDVTGNLLRTGLPFGTHDTHGWPTFAGWPVHDTNTHQQAYYVWLQRAFESGLRLVVAQTVDDEPICKIEPIKNGTDCDETHSIKRQIRRLRGLQDYIDAESGGPGKGWFRLVYSPAQARREIARGKLAVIIGIESSDLFGCSLRNGKAQCTKTDIDRGLREYNRLGVRGMFVAHWTNNAFSGAALEGDTKGAFINVFNRLETGSYIKTGPCPGRGQGEEVRTLSKGELSVLAHYYPVTQPLADEGMPAYPAGKQCNTMGLTRLGRYLIARMMANRMLIEVDHMSERARDTVLAIAERAHYPLLSSHNGTGGVWTTPELRRLFKTGGFASVTPATAPELAAKIKRMARLESLGVGLGTDTGGFASLPGPRADASRNPLRYPFTAFECKLTLTREKSGERTFDLNTDGVAHYGLIADLIADMSANGGRAALPPLFRSAEAYLRTWQRAYAR